MSTPAYFAPGPWWTEPTAFGTIVRDIHGHRIAEVFHDADRPEETVSGTELLIRHAPTIFISLRFAVECLRATGVHQELVHHLTKTISLVMPREEPEPIVKLYA